MKFTYARGERRRNVRLWLNGRVIAEKIVAQGGPLEAKIPAGISDAWIALVLKAERGHRTGLLGKVFLETADITAGT